MANVRFDSPAGFIRVDQGGPECDANAPAQAAAHRPAVLTGGPLRPYSLPAETPPSTM